MILRYLMEDSNYNKLVVDIRQRKEGSYNEFF